MKLSRRGALAGVSSSSSLIIPAPPPPLQLLGTIGGGSSSQASTLCGGGTTTISLAGLPRQLPNDLLRHVTPNPPALQHHPAPLRTPTPPPTPLPQPSSAAQVAAASGLMLATSASAAAAASDAERIFLKCRVCLTEIQEHNNPNVNIFSKDFLDEKIRRYLYVNVSQSVCALYASMGVCVCV